MSNFDGTGPSRPPGASRGGPRLPHGSRSLFTPGSGTTDDIGELGSDARNEFISPGPDLARRRSAPGPAFGRLRNVNDPLGIGELGRSDLNPLGRVGPGTGMILRPPAGSNQPQGVPPGHPQGARFDPFGPPRPGNPNFGGSNPGGLPQGQPVIPFGEPNPDHLPLNPFPDEMPQRNSRNPVPFGGPNPDHEQPPPGFDDMFM